MNDLNESCNILKEKILDSAPDIWERIKKSAARHIAEQLLNELNGVPSRCGKIIFEQVNEMPVARRVA